MSTKRTFILKKKRIKFLTAKRHSSLNTFFKSARFASISVLWSEHAVVAKETFIEFISQDTSLEKPLFITNRMELFKINKLSIIFRFVVLFLI